MASYEKFDYSVRPNKRTQRKMIFDALARYIAVFPRARFSYVGFGSMWFTDFLYAHRRLGLQSLTSIEAPEGFRRAAFNRPFKCVRMVEGYSSTVLPTLTWRRPAIVWLDYDYGPESESLQDLSYLSNQLASRSVLMVTYDAAPPWNENATADERVESVRKVFKNAAPPQVQKPGRGKPRVPHRSSYAPTLTALLWSFLKNELVRNGRAGADDLAWSPLFSFFYRDGAPMITVAAALLNASDREALDRSRPFEHLHYALGETPFSIAIPPLTPRERAELDRRLPCRTVKLPFPLGREQIESYRSLYRYYPLLAEVDL
jgi:Putative O-methyltransferase